MTRDISAFTFQSASSEGEDEAQVDMTFGERSGLDPEVLTENYIPRQAQRLLMRKNKESSGAQILMDLILKASTKLNQDPAFKKSVEESTKRIEQVLTQLQQIK